MQFFDCQSQTCKCLVKDNCSNTMEFQGGGILCQVLHSGFVRDRVNFLYSSYEKLPVCDENSVDNRPVFSCCCVVLTQHQGHFCFSSSPGNKKAVVHKGWKRARSRVTKGMSHTDSIMLGTKHGARREGGIMGVCLRE